MTKRLGLSEDQQKAIRPILEERARAMQELRKRARAGGDRAAMRSEMQELIDNSSKQVEAVLDEKQVQEYRKLREQRRGQQQQPRQKRRGDGPPSP